MAVAVLVSGQPEKPRRVRKRQRSLLPFPVRRLAPRVGGVFPHLTSNAMNCVTFRYSEVMKAPKCPKCDRKDTYPKNWDSCSVPPKKPAPKDRAPASNQHTPNRYQVHARVCLWCGMDFTGTGRAWYCGPVCRQNANRNGMHAPSNAMQEGTELCQPARGVHVRFRILDRDGFRCRYCGRSPKEDGVKLHLDHVTPLSSNGSDSDDNLVSACQHCNLGKGSTPLSSSVP